MFLCAHTSKPQPRQGSRHESPWRCELLNPLSQNYPLYQEDHDPGDGADGPVGPSSVPDQWRRGWRRSADGAASASGGGNGSGGGSGGGRGGAARRGPGLETGVHVNGDARVGVRAASPPQGRRALCCEPLAGRAWAVLAWQMEAAR
jgi:hypothetical protein